MLEIAMEVYKMLGLVLVFFLGFASANFINAYFVYGNEFPLGISGFGFYGDVKAPFDLVGLDNIEVYDDKVVIYVQGASLSQYAPTGSMEPVLNEGSNGIRIVPLNEDEIHIGDIVSFEQEDRLIVHRVIEKGADNEGTYFITKGDNNNVSDGKIRFEDIKYITIGVIY